MDEMPTTSKEKYEALILMEHIGGGFVSRLADAWLHSDSANDARLTAAFPELLAKYHRMAVAEAQGLINSI